VQACKQQQGAQEHQCPGLAAGRADGERNDASGSRPNASAGGIAGRCARRGALPKADWTPSAIASGTTASERASENQA
jgi:hypothetical protein